MTLERTQWIPKPKGKPPLLWLPLEALEWCAYVIEYGAAVYSLDNWRNACHPEEYAQAALRHIHQARTAPNDSESGLPHLAHAAVDCMFALVLGCGKPKVEDMTNLQGKLLDALADGTERTTDELKRLVNHSRPAVVLTQLVQSGNVTKLMDTNGVVRWKLQQTR